MSVSKLKDDTGMFRGLLFFPLPSKYTMGHACAGGPPAFKIGTQIWDDLFSWPLLLISTLDISKPT
jgi:hypothetical protein